MINRQNTLIDRAFEFIVLNHFLKKTETRFREMLTNQHTDFSGIGTPMNFLYVLRTFVRNSSLLSFDRPSNFQRISFVSDSSTKSKTNNFG